MLHTLMIVHGIITLILITLVLLQFGKGAEAGLFSGGGSDAFSLEANKVTSFLK